MTTRTMLTAVAVLLAMNLAVALERPLRAQAEGPATGACVRMTGDCVITTVNQCLIQFGAWYGEGTTCTGLEPCDTQPINGCPPISQACCLPDGSCAVLTNALCVDAGGSPQNPGVYCTDQPCPAVCDEDLDGNGVVDTVDFLQLLAAWGPCP